MIVVLEIIDFLLLYSYGVGWIVAVVATEESPGSIEKSAR